MRYIFLLASIVIFTRQAVAISEGQSVPAQIFSLANGDALSISKFQGQVVYLDFWASWCGPCKRSLPWLQEIAERFKERGLRVVAVNLDQNSVDGQKFIRELGLKALEVHFDPDGVSAEAFSVDSMPSSVLIDKSGKVRAVLHGFRESEKEELVTKIEGLL
ncbi:MAG: TlpA family protein disulfide reductase [Oligoflexia bacterium]|nr:TlpA family protein disulfide reductase [Oligoflexia bacterium]